MVGICSTDLFTTTTQAIEIYAEREWGGNIHQSIEMLMLAMLTCPTRPIPPPPASDGTIVPIDLAEMDIGMEEVKEYMKQRRRSTAHNSHPTIVFYSLGTINRFHSCES